MGAVPTSARDPIFWLHHANVDRLWSAWMKGANRILPAPGSTWGPTTWSFDVAGNWTQQDEYARRAAVLELSLR